MKVWFRLVTQTLVVVIMGTLVLAASAKAEESVPFHVSIPTVTQTPTLTGHMDASWAGAAQVQLQYDFTYQRVAHDTTNVYLAQSGDALYVAFVCSQSTPVVATQRTNGAGVTSDDNVTILLWPSGTQGFAYSFSANALGTRYQTSSENTAYAPDWQAVSHRGNDGFTVTMRIPLNVIRGRLSDGTRIQIIRQNVSTGSVYVWAHGREQTNVADPLFAGVVQVAAAKNVKPRPEPRFQVYGLDEVASRGDGTSTSRIGADLALPVTDTASFLASVHPDYSNVEIDQQTIAPAEFPRQYQEVRPFFTQAGNAFDYHFGCIGCPMTLYTPAIPSFREGYALEGTQGKFIFSGFDAVGAGRNDQGESLNYVDQSDSRSWQADLQQVSVNAPGFYDSVKTIATGYKDARSNAAVWLNAGNDEGTDVTDSSLAKYFEAGTGISSATSSLTLDYLRVGAQFLPVDGYVQHPDVVGWQILGNKTFNFQERSPLASISLSADWDRFNDHSAASDQTDNMLSVAVAARNQLGLIFSTGSSYLLTGNIGMAPFTQNVVEVTYKAQTATPSLVSYGFGRYYQGQLGAWQSQTTIPLSRGLLLGLEVDGTMYAPDNHAIAPARQWLERASLDVQFGKSASLDVGGRRIFGVSAPTGYSGFLGDNIDASNVSLGLHFLRSHNEFYAVYGDPSQLYTQHAVFFKWIRYIGAPKGT